MHRYFRTTGRAMTFNVRLDEKQFTAILAELQKQTAAIERLEADVDWLTGISVPVDENLAVIKRLLCKAFRPDTPKILGIGPMTQIEENGVMKFQFPILIPAATNPANVYERYAKTDLDGADYPPVKLDPAIDTEVLITASKGATLTAVVTDWDDSENYANSAPFVYVVKDKVPPEVPGGVSGIGTMTEVGDDVPDGPVV